LGSITSRIKWPPDPRDQRILRYEPALVVENGKVIKKIVESSVKIEKKVKVDEKEAVKVAAPKHEPVKIKVKPE
jgi:hypothetical protein